jgi:FAD synthase
MAFNHENLKVYQRTLPFNSKKMFLLNHETHEIHEKLHVLHVLHGENFPHGSARKGNVFPGLRPSLITEKCRPIL